jgi:STAS domain
VRAVAGAEPAPRWIVVAAEPITDVDTTAADMLHNLDVALNDDGVHLVFAELKDPVRHKIDRYELTRTIDSSHFFPTLEAAIAAFQAELGAERRPADRNTERDGPVRSDPAGRVVGWLVTGASRTPGGRRHRPGRSRKLEQRHARPTADRPGGHAQRGGPA